MKHLILLWLSAFLMTSAIAQNHFRIKDGSKNYVAELMVHCKDGECTGSGEIRLISKKTGKHFQTLKSDDLFIFLNEKNLPSINVVELYGEQSAVIFDDFNFDGYEDIAIRNGNQSSYGGPSYDVYVYNVTRRQFVLSKELTELVFSNLGMFHVDHKRKRIITFSKSGCCWHLTTEYEVIPGKGLVTVYELEEAVSASEENKVHITSRNLVNGKWIEKTVTKPLDEYYGQ